MKPRVTYRVKRDYLLCRIQLYGQGKGEYDTGIRTPKEQFDAEKQICGLPSVQKFMTDTKESIEYIYRPGMSAAELWEANTVKQDSQRVYTLNDAFAYYLIGKQIAEATKRNFSGTMDKASRLLATPLTQITPASVLSFVNGLQGEESTKFLHYIQLKTVINKFVRDHQIKIHFNLENIIKAPKKKEVLEGEEDYLTLADVQLLLDIDLSEQDHIEYARDLFCLMCFTGMAIADLCLFTPKMVSKDKKWIVYYRKKTHNKCEIPVFDTTLKLIEKHKWPCRISARTVQHHCAEYITKLLDKKVTPHTARKTWGSVALEVGFSMESVSKMLGHSSIAITESTYAKVTKQKIQREMNQIPDTIKALI